MLLQSVVFYSDPCQAQEIYLRSRQGRILADRTGHCVRIPEGETLSTFTYMNLFDGGFWKNVSGMADFSCRLLLCGKAMIRLWIMQDGKKSLLAERQADCPSAAVVELPFGIQSQGLVFFTMEAAMETVLYSASYEAACTPAQTHMSLVICTYRRQEALGHIIDVLKGSRFFDPDSPCYGKLSIRVVDNGAQMNEQYERPFRVYRNRNEGGAGGFRRGMEESRRDEQSYGISHVILMDDDVDIIPETFYRLYALLSVMKEEMRSRVVAGRMFRKDTPWVQYTAAEIWNDSDIAHVGFLQDMRDEAALLDVNACDGEYSGWWFACFPMDYIRDNDPIPFFLHCDDVEYGLRHGGIPIILNGIQVWHETADRRQNPRIDYYDTRNAMIVNDLLGMSREELERRWLEKITAFHVRGEVLSEYMAIRAMEDYLKGQAWLRRVDGGSLNDRLSRVKLYRWTRFMNSVRWRLALKKLRKISPWRCR